DFIAAGVWDATPVETELLVQADRLVGGSNAVLVIDACDQLHPSNSREETTATPARASGLGWSERVFRPNVERHERNRKWLWRRSIVPSRRWALWLCVGGCRLWAERAVPSGAHSSQACLGSRYSAAPQGVYPADVRKIWPVAKRGRPRQRHVPDILSIPAEDMLANAKWRTISWRTGTK